MCGIVGFVSVHSEAMAMKLVERLSALEYRGYDSAGIALVESDRLVIVKSVGEISKLSDRLSTQHRKRKSMVGLAHTRWATHGIPSELNALPISTSDQSMAIVFNGIVENNFEIRKKLELDGYKFKTENDAETLLLWIAAHFAGDWTMAVRTALPEIRGRFAFGLILAAHPEQLIVAKRGSPLVLGRGENGFAVASDVIAIKADVTKVHYLDDDTIAVMRPSGVTLLNVAGVEIIASYVEVPIFESIGRQDGFDTYTLQEIYAQPETLAAGVRSAVKSKKHISELARKIDRVVFIGCGTSLHAGLVGKSMVERYAGIAAEANIASEFHIGTPVITSNTLAVFLSQSGETADTLACLELAKSRGAKTVAICNSRASSMARLTDIYLPIGCGPEIGVASTKAYTGMLVQVVFMSIALGLGRDFVDEDVWDQHLLAAIELPDQVSKILATKPALQKIARSLRERRNFSFIGRDVFFPTALEGALKLRELSYRNAEGFGGGELKHGTLALIEQGYPVIAVAPRVPSTGKMVGNILEAKSRGAKIIGIISEGDEELARVCDDYISIPETLPAFLPILAVIPLQILAFEVAKSLGRNIDRPRNLAKSVTVE